MNRTLLVALRDFRQITTTRAFRITLLIVPLMIAVSIGASTLLRPPVNAAYIVADATGRYAGVIEHRLDLNYQRQLLGDLSAYVQRWKLSSAAPDAVWAQGRGWFSDAEIENFVASGGVAAALQHLQSRLPQNAAVFQPAPPPFIAVEPPTGVPTNEGPARFGAALAPYLEHDIATQQGKRPLALAVYIPRDLGAPDAVVRMWTNGRPNAALIDTFRAELTRAARLAALQANGLSPSAAAQIETIEPRLQVLAPPAGGGRAGLTIRSVVPLALAYLLMMSALITGNMMLQGVIEERSNKLLEAIMACVHPSEFLYGKLLGLGAVGLTIVTVWAGCAVGAAFALQGDVADLMRSSLSAMNQPWMIAATVFYFLSGYMILSMAYLAVGSLSDSMQDAQAYLMPMVMVIMLPVFLMVSSTVQNPDGLFPRILSWIPLYTPFAMLARLGGGVSVTEVLGTGALLIVFVALEFIALGRVFRASLLSTGQPPKLGAFVKLMMRTSGQ